MHPVNHWRKEEVPLKSPVLRLAQPVNHHLLQRRRVLIGCRQLTDLRWKLSLEREPHLSENPPPVWFQANCQVSV